MKKRGKEKTKKRKKSNVSRVITKKVRVKVKGYVEKKYKGKTFRRRKLLLKRVKAVTIKCNKFIKGEKAGKATKNTDKFARSFEKDLTAAKKKIGNKRKVTIGATMSCTSKKGRKFVINSYFERDLLPKSVGVPLLMSKLSQTIHSYQIRRDIKSIKLTQIHLEAIVK